MVKYKQTNKIAKNRREPTWPIIYSFLVNGLITLGSTANPQKKPAIAPPAWPKVSDVAPAAMMLKMIIMITMNISMHLTCSNCCPLNSNQFTRSIPNNPNKIPKSAVEAPIEVDGSITELKRFPPILKNKMTSN